MSDEPTVIDSELQEAGPFHLVAATLEIPLAPRFHSNIRHGIEQVLAKWLTKYIPALGCVLLTIQYPVIIHGTTARLIDPTAICVVRIQMEGLGFRPVVGSKLTGRIVLETASNVSLLLYNTFSATIDRPQLGSTADWRFDSKRIPEYPGVSADQPEQDFFAQAQQVDQDVAADAGEDTAAEPDAETAAEQAFEVQQIGCWVNRRSGETLGGSDGLLEFTITSLTVSGLALTCHGSLLDDPFKQPTPEEPEARRMRFTEDDLEPELVVVNEADEESDELPDAPGESQAAPAPQPDPPARTKKRKDKTPAAASEPAAAAQKKKKRSESASAPASNGARPKKRSKKDA